MIIFKGINIPRVNGITLFPFILLRPKTPSKELINHERIHIKQQLELLVLPFYIWYVLEWLWHFIKVGNFWSAYHMISFEKEAYAHDKDLKYLSNREFWAFLKFL